ncbi:hypothetical protein TNCV_465091 [Trichonephila clavipes]|nr:hypothetical protein TNCV_465091 [Trichonephila clavipes]
MCIRDAQLGKIKSEIALAVGLFKQIRRLGWTVKGVKEGRFVLGTFRSERMRGLYRSRQNYSLRVMLVLVHIDITPPQEPMAITTTNNGPSQAV